MTPKELDMIERRVGCAGISTFNETARDDITALVAEVRRLRTAVERAAQLCYAHPSLAEEIRGLA